MFRKPKKKPSALRSSGSAGGGASSNDAHDAPTSASGFAAGKKRRRPRQTSSSSEEDNDNEEDTSGLLQQIRHERDNNKSSKKSISSTPLLNTSSTSTTSSSKKKSNKNDNGWMHQYKSNDSQMTVQEMATRTAEYHPTESNSKQSASTTGDDNNNDASASSQNAQIAALQKQPRNKFLAGPLRATTFVRTTARFDYQPDICKDYKETGFCGFGDTCIYLHDRGDTKTGWQMEQEYEEKKKKEEEKRGKEMEQFMNSMMTGGGGGEGNNKNGMQQSSSSMNNNDEQLTEDGIPFACHLCRGPFQNPIVTTCGHYYCEKCMLAHVREVGTGCPICQKDTHGVLNHAQKLVAKKRRLVGRDGTWEEYLERSKGGGDGDDGV